MLFVLLANALFLFSAYMCASINDFDFLTGTGALSVLILFVALAFTGFSLKNRNYLPGTGGLPSNQGFHNHSTLENAAESHLDQSFSYHDDAPLMQHDLD